MLVFLGMIYCKCINVLNVFVECNVENMIIELKLCLYKYEKYCIFRNYFF